VTIRVLLVDDQDLVRAGFALVLGSQSDLAVVGEAADGAAAVRLARECPADVMVMDVRMPVLDGVAATREICRAAERPRVLILTTFDLDEYAFAALRAGASGFLLKSAPPEELLYAIRSVHNGDSVVAPSTTRRLIGRFLPHLPAAGAPLPGLAELTAREREVLTEVGSGRSNTEIAALLHISEATVKTHVGHIMAKLGLRDRIQAVVYAYETGLIAPQGRSAGRLPAPGGSPGRGAGSDRHRPARRSVRRSRAGYRGPGPARYGALRISTGAARAMGPANDMPGMPGMRSRGRRIALAGNSHPRGR
jgi:DNA-binding NarL/FixJ family response regulator